MTQLMNSSVSCLFQTKITNVIPEEHRAVINCVELTHQVTQELTYITVDELIVNHGYEQDATLVENSNVAIEIVSNFFIKGNAQAESSIPGLFAAGDILAYDGKLNLINGAFQDAINAVNCAKQFIQPDAQKGGMVSTLNEVFRNK